MSKQSRTIAEKQKDLTNILNWFESEEFTPEEAIEKYKDAQNIAKEIEEELLEQKNTINVLAKSFETA